MGIPMLLLSIFTFVELNCENLFDTRHDSLKNDTEFLPTSARRWTPYRYWRKLNRIGQEIVACGVLDTMEVMPDMVALTEVENDSVLVDLTRRSLLRHASYEYVMTNSPDERGIDVALLWSPFSFRLICHRALRIDPPKQFRPTRDILYVSGEVITGDTLHVFVVHAPSRASGERATRPYRQLVAERLAAAVDSVRQATHDARILVAGDFNDYSGDDALQTLCAHGLTEVSFGVTGRHGAKGTYRWRGRWDSLDHIFCCSKLAAHLLECHVNDAPFLLEEDSKYGGVKPRRTYQGPKYMDGFSDHLPLVAVFSF